VRKLKKLENKKSDASLASLFLLNNIEQRIN